MIRARVNGANLSSCYGDRVAIIAKVEEHNGTNCVVTTTDDKRINAIFSEISHIAPNTWVEITGVVENDEKIRANSVNKSFVCCEYYIKRIFFYRLLVTVMKNHFSKKAITLCWNSLKSVQT